MASLQKALDKILTNTKTVILVNSIQFKANRADLGSMKVKWFIVK